MTRHEFFELFCCTLHFIKNTLKFERLTLTNEFTHIENHAKRVQDDLEASTKLPFITEHAIEILKKLFVQDVKIGKELILTPLKDIYDGYKYKVPDFEELRKSVAGFFCPLLIGALGVEGFYKVLENILLERSVLFVSENLNLLTSTV